MKHTLITNVWRKPIEGKVSQAFPDEFGQDSLCAKEIEVFVFEEAPEIDSVGASGKIQRMKGYKSSYKVRFGSYRIGLTVEEDTIVFERALHRKDIYRFFS